MTDLNTFRLSMRKVAFAKDNVILKQLQSHKRVEKAHRDAAQAQAVTWIEAIRNSDQTGLMDVFMAEYGLSTNEGIALMCLAEALLRVPDAETMSELIEDKIAPSNWGSHLGQSSSSLVNASTWALLLTGKVLDDEKPMAGVLHGAIKRMGEPVIRQAVRRAMRELGAQFVLGQDIKEAIKNGKSARKKGYTFSYDMLGEAARTAADAQEFFESYQHAISALASQCKSDLVRENPGISIKLSALFERYEYAQRDRVMDVLVPRVLKLSKMARDAKMGLNIDAEEADRLELSMDVIEAVVRNPSLAGWDGFGIVVQAYGKRASHVIEWFAELARQTEQKFMLRLVKGAYWDTEIKLAQVEGLDGFPVFSNKSATDISYVENAARLLELTDVIYPQFATHNAHTVAMVQALGADPEKFEFQKLHGMGDGLYAEVMKDAGARCRIYAPVGVHEDLLAYLVRRLLENGANSSFVNQIMDKNVPAITVAADPYETFKTASVTGVIHPTKLFGKRQNSKGWGLSYVEDVQDIEDARATFKNTIWNVASKIVAKPTGKVVHDIANPATGALTAKAQFANSEDVAQAVKNAEPWNISPKERANVLRKVADLYEANFGEIFAILTREAGKTPRDAIAELREAVDFLRFYADEAEANHAKARGIFACISPWNFPLAIFTGQIAAALAAGNAVIAKPAESTPVIAARAVDWMLQAGVPQSAIQLLLGFGSDIGSAITQNPAIDGVCFTGSTHTAQLINRSMAKHMSPTAPLIAETGGLNAMIVDSTALPEQAVRDILNSAFQSAGQRCSALRVLYVQEDVAQKVLEMLYGAMDALKIGDPWEFQTDIGPVIDQKAKDGIMAHIKTAGKEGRIMKSLSARSEGTFISPTVISLNNISELEREIFGPVLHVIAYKASNIDRVIADINATGYGLTFGIHSRIDDRIEHITDKIEAGNIYVNRNQIGAIVGSQPFGGEGLSGTGPKAGGALYLNRFCDFEVGFVKADVQFDGSLAQLISAAKPLEQHIIRQEILPGPTGESNQWSVHPRGVIICGGPSLEAAQDQAKTVEANGCVAIIAPNLDANELANVAYDGVVYWGEGRALREVLAGRDGAILPLITAKDFAPWCWVERHLCIDTTAAGGNAQLLASQ